MENIILAPGGMDDFERQLLEKVKNDFDALIEIINQNFNCILQATFIGAIVCIHRFNET